MFSFVVETLMVLALTGFGAKKINHTCVCNYVCTFTYVCKRII